MRTNIFRISLILSLLQGAAPLEYFVGVWLASFRLSLPYLVGGSGLLLLALYLLIAMPETAFAPVVAEEQRTLAGMSTTLRQGLGSFATARCCR